MNDGEETTVVMASDSAKKTKDPDMAMIAYTENHSKLTLFAWLSLMLGKTFARSKHTATLICRKAIKQPSSKKVAMYALSLPN